ncbi:hypothetical protein [Anoxybacillus sp. UARK-01]|uniref:hypothetical protein n=1 Tax=Anoxybacillus sp. UARK-01 TaxID=1895648 RepID=UPI00191BC97B|nr:hypothetical protein [Anoxybacillus sp. UARK-01]
MNKTIYAIAAVIAAIFLYRYRYRLLNGALSIRPLQTLLVRAGMSIPFVRKAVVSQVFH